MRFLILGLNYLPESTSIGPYTADLAEYLHTHGHQVQVITGFPMAPQWKIWDGYSGKWFMREHIHRIAVLRTYLYVPRNPRKALQRILFDMSFTISALIGGVFAGSCDLIVVISPPLQIGLTGWLLSIIKRQPFFFHIQDLVPDAAIATGMLSEQSRAVAIARQLERFIYRRACGIGVICDGFVRNLLAKGVPAHKIVRLPNYIDLTFIEPQARENEFRRIHGLHNEDFVVMYSGSVAGKQGLHTFVEAADLLRDQPAIVFVLIGEGPYLAELTQMAEQRSLTNLRFLPLQPREGLPQQLAAADILCLTQRRSITDIVFPGKLLYYMAAARPILAAVSAESETGRFIVEHQVGTVVPPENPQALADAVLHLYREGAGSLGSNGRRVVEEQFDRRIVLQRFTQYLEQFARP